jgi:hypothetical protein
MVLPIITSVSREILRSVPNLQREAAYALGATRWEVTRIAVLSYAKRGLFGAVILGLGRALGETMAVTMVIGNTPQIKASLFAPGYTLAAGSTTSCTWTGITDFTGGDINARPNLACDPNQTVGTADVTGLPYAINPACFTKPLAQGDIGNFSRNRVRLPSIFNNDIAIFRTEDGEKREIQLGGVYNIFNHVNFKDINAAMTFALFSPRWRPVCAAGTTWPMQRWHKPHVAHRTRLARASQTTNNGAPSARAISARDADRYG